MAKAKTPYQYVPGQNRLTNNFRANMAIFAVAAVIIAVLSLLGIGNLAFKLPGTSTPGVEKTSVFAHLVVFFISYFFTSFWFNPDLDLRENRPGKGSFPLKWVIRKVGRAQKKAPFFKFILVPLEIVLTPLHYVLNSFWRNFWHPFGHAFTHRGAVHWPLLGSQLKILYMFLPYWLTASLLGLSGRAPFVVGDLRDSLFSHGGLYYRLLHDPLLITMYVAIMTADIMHTSVDYWDSVRNGTKFVPPPLIAPRGYVWRFYKFLTGRLWGKRPS